MRTVESGADEERPILVFLEERDRFGSDFAVGVRLVRCRRCVIRERAAELPRRREIGQLCFLVFVDPARIDEDIPRRRIVQPAGADLSGISVVIDLADARREVSVALEHLRQREHIGQYRPEIGLQLVNARGIGPKTRQQRNPARTAQRKLVVGAIESHTARGQPIEVRRLHHRMTVDPHVVVEIVGHDDENVRRATCLLGERRLRRADDAGDEKRREGQARHDGHLRTASTRRNPRFDAPLVTSDLPRLPTR